MQTMKATTIAKWFLSQEAMTPRRLQRLVFYAYAWYLTLRNSSAECLEKKLFDEPILAWAHGPAIYSLVEEYRECYFATLPKENRNESMLDEDILEILRDVWEVYASFDDVGLEEMSRKEDPWILARGHANPLINGMAIMDDKEIFRFYTKYAVVA